MPAEIIHTVKCGEGRFTIDCEETVTQYDHTGRVVGIFKAYDTPNLCAWIMEHAPKNEKRGPMTLSHGNYSPRN